VQSTSPVLDILKNPVEVSFLSNCDKLENLTTNEATPNGVNVTQLVGTIDAIKGNPEIAKFTFNADTNWIKGGNCQTSFKGFYGALTNDTSRKSPLIMIGDEPPVLLGENKGPNAVEAILHALASCLCVGFVYNASAKGIKIESLKFISEGSLNLHRFLGLSEDMRAGYENINITMHVKSDASSEDIQEL